jgi:hypothetical protein
MVNIILRAGTVGPAVVIRGGCFMVGLGRLPAGQFRGLAGGVRTQSVSIAALRQDAGT